jgi:hypothetical protein
MSKLVAAVMIGTVLAGTAAASPLADLRWSKRILLVFAAPDDPMLDEQTKLLSALPRDDIAGRDLLVLLVPPDGTTSTLFGTPERSLPSAPLRAAYDVANGSSFTALLLGKDGGSKWRENRPARAAELFELIDAMPMRRQEMRGNGGDG